MRTKYLIITMNAIFDYLSIAKEFNISENIVREIENEVKRDIPHDDMIMELHILHALKSYAQKHQSVIA